MKKIIIFLLVGALFNTVVKAQTKEVKKDEKVLKNTIKNKKEERREVGKDLAHLKIKGALQERKEVRHLRKSSHRQNKHLKRHGIKHPMKKAREKISDEKEIKN